MKKIFNVRDAAAFLDVHPNTVRVWSRQGMLPCYRVGKRGDRRFKLEDLVPFMQTDQEWREKRGSANRDS